MEASIGESLMKTKEKQKIKIGFPFKLYFKQLFCPDLYVRLINPFRFWHRYKLDRLEACWDLNTIQHLERCKKLKLQPDKQQENNEPLANLPGKKSEPQHSDSLKSSPCQGKCFKTDSITLSTQIDGDRELSRENISQETILITRPSIKLKYRGVSYTKHIVAVNLKTINVKPSYVNPNNSNKLSSPYKSKIV